jgi:hypothetical protein
MNQLCQTRPVLHLCHLHSGTGPVEPLSPALDTFVETHDRELRGPWLTVHRTSGVVRLCGEVDVRGARPGGAAPTGGTPARRLDRSGEEVGSCSRLTVLGLPGKAAVGKVRGVGPSHVPKTPYPKDGCGLLLTGPP